MTVDRTIINRIIKLLALAESNSEAEAKLAAERANELLIKHNLSLQSVQAQKDENDFSDYTEQVGYEGRRLQTEQKFIIPLLQNYFFIVCIHSKPRHQWMQISFIGESSNVEVARYVHDFLTVKFKELWRVHKKETQCPESSRQSYYEGLRDGLSHQFEEVKKRVESTEKALLVVDKKVELFVKKTHPRLKSMRLNATVNDELALNRGFEAGVTLKIQKGIGGPKSTRVHGAPKRLGAGEY